jgi:transposase InsO family protein
LLSKEQSQSFATTVAESYLIVCIDLFSRRMVCSKLNHRMDAALVIEAIHRHLGQRQVEAEQLLGHTDQGRQYRASDYRDLLSKHEIRCSMSAKACCRDAPVVESFFSTL